MISSSRLGGCVRIAAFDLGRLSRLTAGGAGLAVAVFGALILPLSLQGVPPAGPLSDPAAAFVPAGLALLSQAVPVHRHTAGRVVRGLATLLALGAAALGAAALHAHAAAAVATTLAGLALAGLDLHVQRRSPDAVRLRIADPLLVGSAMIALVALVPRLFDHTFPAGGGPGRVMSSYDAGALLLLAFGAVLARPESGPPDTTTAGPGRGVRRLLPVLIAVPVTAALVSALLARTGVSRSAAAISTGAILGVLATLGLVGYLVRTLEGADRRQRDLAGELHDRQDFAEALLQSMNDAVMVLDADYRVIDVNRRWRELTGHTADEPVRFDPPPLPPAAGGDWLMPRVDGSTVPVVATMAAIPDAHGVPRGYVATYVDIAERKRVEEEIGAHAAELEQGNERLREANTRLAAALTFKNDLTSMLTHDVAQPISSIASLAELLRADWDDLPDDIRLELATKIDKNTQRLIKMMNDLQLLFRLDMGSISARQAPVPLRELVEKVTAAKAPAGDDGITIEIDDEISVLADRAHLLAVVQNLVTNALTYGKPPVRVHARRTGDLVELTVSDEGPGIPADLLPNLFGRVMRSAGLGLFIVRHLVEANGGSVRYDQATPQGANLTVTLEAATH
jgi:signal transduction histidine kinase